MTFYTGQNNIFYLELAVDRAEFIKLNDFDANEVPDPDELLAQNRYTDGEVRPAVVADSEQDELLKSLGM